MYPPLSRYIKFSIQQFNQISDPRKEALKKISSYIQTRLDVNEDVKLTFICTHNSRRSHMSQLWAKTAADYYGIPSVATFSGGTEATAFNLRAVAAMGRAGFQIKELTDGENPVYAIGSSDRLDPVKAFSKKYSDASNPQANFCAVITCSDADKNCPIVFGAISRVSIPYDDPKAFDDTSREAAKYDERCRQISREMFWIFSQIKVKG